MSVTQVFNVGGAAAEEDSDEIGDEILKSGNDEEVERSEDEVAGEDAETEATKPSDGEMSSEGIEENGESGRTAVEEEAPSDNYDEIDGDSDDAEEPAQP